MRIRLLKLIAALIPSLAGACGGDNVSGASPSAPLYSENPRCPVRLALLPVFAAKSRTVQALHTRGPLTVVAVGSSSTAGYGASSPEAAYPAQLQAKLAERWPRSAVRVVNAGVSGSLLEGIRERFPSDVYSANPDLVILQTGTIEATRKLPLGPFLDRFRATISELTSRGYEVAILDSQYYPGEGESEAYRAFQDSMGAIALARHLPLIRRYAMMKYFVDSGRYTAEQLLFTDAFHPSDLTYECMAQYIVNGLEVAETPLR